MGYAYIFSIGVSRFFGAGISYEDGVWILRLPFLIVGFCFHEEATGVKIFNAYINTKK